LAASKKADSLERDNNANTENSVARIRAAIDATILIADVASRSGYVRRRQRRIQPFVVGDGEQVVTLHVDSRAGQIRSCRRQRVADLQIAQPGIRPVLHIEAAERAAEGVVEID